jgi:hypothetical protein
MNTRGSGHRASVQLLAFTLEADSNPGHGAEKAGQVWCRDKRLAAVIPVCVAPWRILW